MTLTEFLSARLDEDEATARRCDLLRAGDPFPDGSGQADNDGFPSYPWGAEEDELLYMAGVGHPTHVLAEVAAKRRIVARLPANFDDVFARHSPSDGITMTIRDLAAVYADHPDYQPEWRVR